MLNLLKKIKKLRIRLYERYQPFITSYPGFRCHVADKSSFLSMWDEIFEREIYKFDTENLTPYIVDCGANIGLSCIYLKKRFPKAEIVAFEPDTRIYAILIKNIRSAGLDGIQTINKGLWSSETTKSFYSEGADGGRIATEQDTDGLTTITLERLSGYLEKTVDFLKIDIEGSELEVLKECKQNLKNVEKMFVEYHSFAGKPEGLSEILSILSDAGFTFYIESTGVRSEYPFMKVDTYLGYDNQLNIFAYRPNR